MIHTHVRTPARTIRPATPAAGSVTWAAVDLAGCRTDFLQSVDLRRLPKPAADAIRQELVARRNER